MNDVWVLIPITCSLGLFALIGTIWVSSIHSERQRAKLEAELRSRMLEKAGRTDPELLHGLGESESRLLARAHILRGVRWASVLIVLGGTFAALSRFEDSDFLVTGLLMVAAGVGFAGATVIALRLGRNWGILGPVAGDAGGNRTDAG